MIASPWCRAIALDYDGTLTAGPHPDEAVLDRLSSWRTGGGRIVLATGRILDHLLEDFPDVSDVVDLVVAENGAVLWDGERSRLLASPVDDALSDALCARGVPCRRGSVILATHGDYSLSIEAAICELGLDVQLVPNRAELMVLPAGISKGTGIRVALRTLGLSPHSAIAIGDGENDLSLLQCCEIGVAVANAVPILRHAADILTDAPDAAGVAEVIDGPLLRGPDSAHSTRWQIEIGRDQQGRMVSIPASQIDVLVCGKSGGGKSYLAGLIAEQLIELDYSMLIVDPEGDHNALAQLPGVVAIGSTGSIPPVEHLIALLQQHLGTVTVDLSLQPDAVRDDFYRHAPAAIESLRAARGVPHWIVLDEAHTPLRWEGAIRSLFDGNRKGHLLVTFDPGQLPESVVDQMDIVIITSGTDGLEPILRSFGCDKSQFDLLAADACTGDAVILRRSFAGTPSEPVRVRTPKRRTGHVRHLHKYTAGRLPDWRRFYFRNALDELSGSPAANIAEFHHEIARCDPDVIDHHARGHDFSRWIGAALGDEDTARAIEAIERTLVLAGSSTPHIDRARALILEAIERRYGGDDAQSGATDVG